MFNESEITCPYCGELNTVFFDASEGSQVTVTDCTVCCHPIRLDIQVAGEASDDGDESGESDTSSGTRVTVRASRE